MSVNDLFLYLHFIFIIIVIIISQKCLILGGARRFLAYSNPYKF